MTSQAAWYSLVGVLFVGYLVLEGFDFGLGMALPFIGRSDVQRRLVINTMGPFFLGNEVWLVATAGLLIGALPTLEGNLLTGLYPLIVAVLVSWIVRDAGIWFRSRRSGRGWRLTWDVAIVIGSALLAVAWGVIFGDLLRGLPLGASGRVAAGSGSLIDPFSLLCGLALAAVCCVHGAVFVALRTTGTLRERAVRVTGRTLPAAVVLLALAAAVGALTRQVRVSVGRPAVVLALVVVLALLLVVATMAVSRNRPGWAFVATTLATALPVGVLAVAAYPYALLWNTPARSGLVLAQAIGGTSTLDVLTYMLLPVFPIILIYQIWSWWVFGWRSDGLRRSVFY